MKTARFEVLSQREVERIHATSVEVLQDVGIRVDYQTARDLFRQAGAQVDDGSRCVRIPESLVRWAGCAAAPWPGRRLRRTQPDQIPQ
jgi:trimethylamine--corrinoid protein Co-methyltransferase